tara:strand:+ start:71 stop:262 length:192 start_codon:yes stop_codon:yes gene_type:complete
MMKTFEIDEYTLDILISNLKDSIGVCYSVDSLSKETAKSYPYATGYSRECMRSVVETLEAIKN